jgi:DNA-binding transcriptional LysR family regulator
MPDMNDIELRRLDMTMLLVFSETLRLRKLTLVAGKLGLTQSAISHTLGRLRDAFGDPLFLRKPHGLEPTARALALESSVASLLDLARDALAAPKAFSPATAEGGVRIAALDYHASILGPPMCRIFEKKAPGLKLIMRSAVRQAASDLLDANEVDLIVGFAAGTARAHGVCKLYEETYCVAARRSNTAFDGSLKSFLAARHLLVSLSGDAQGIVDHALAARGMTRTIDVVYPLFFPALATVSETDLICTLPKRLAAANATRFKLKLFPPPLALRPFPVNAVWHRRNDKNGAVQWVVQQLQDLAAEG